MCLVAASDPSSSPLRAAEAPRGENGPFPCTRRFATIIARRGPRQHRVKRGGMPTVEVWIAMSENGDCEVATDEDTAIERMIDGSADDLAGTVCRVVKLNVTMSEPLAEHGSGAAVDVTVPDDAGRTEEVDTD